MGRARSLLREFNVGEPTQTQLARALEPRFVEDEASATVTVRKICERTLDDWHKGWARNPIGLTVTRIRRFVAGEQLSFLAELGQPEHSQAARQAKPKGQAPRRGQTKGTTRRPPQVQYTEADRVAAEERARARRAERAVARQIADAAPLPLHEEAT